eukprot:403354318
MHQYIIPYLLCILQFSQSVVLQTCFGGTASSFPKMIGTTNGSTRILTMDVDSVGNILAGGTSFDANFVTSSLPPTPFAIYYDSSGAITWAKQFPGNGPEYVQLAKIINSASSILIYQDEISPPTSTFAISHISNTDGSLQTTLTDSSGPHYGLFSNVGLSVVDSSTFILVMTPMEQYLCILKFTISPSLQVLTNKVYQNANTYPVALVMGVGDYAFASAYSTYPRNYLIKISISTGDLIEQLYNSNGSPSNYIGIMAFLDSGTYQYVFGCYQYNQLGYLRVQMSGSSYNQFDKYVYAISQNCLGFEATSTSTVRALIQRSGNLLYQTYSFSSNSLISLKIVSYSGYNTIMTQAVLTPSVIYYAGYSEGVYATTGPQSFPYQVSFIMKYDEAGSCLSAGTAGWDNLGLSYQSESWIMDTNPFYGSIHSYDLTPGFLSSAFGIGSNLARPWCAAGVVAVGFTTPSSIPTYTYYIGSGPLTIEIPSQINNTCTDAVYTNTLNLITSPSPQSWQLDNNFNVTVESNLPNDARIYTFNLIQKIQNNEQVTVQFKIEFIDQCSSLTVSYTSIANYDYNIGTTKLDIVFNPITSTMSTATCGAFVYYITDTAGLALNPLIFTWTLSNMTLSVFTSDPGLVNTIQTIHYKAYHSNYPGISADYNMNVNFKVSCLMDVITPPVDTAYTYTLGLSQQFAPGTFTSLYTICNNYTFQCQDINGVQCMTSGSAMINFVTATSSLPTSMTISFTTFQYTPLELYIVALGAGTVKAKQKLTIDVYRPCLYTIIAPTNISDVQYKINTNATNITFVAWTESYGSCTPFIYTVEINGNLTNTNGYITFNPALRLFIINATEAAAIGTYVINLFGTLTQDGKAANMSFTVYILPNNDGAPAFSSDIIDIELTVPQTKDVTIPGITDPDGDGYSISVTLGQTQQFVTWKNPKFSIKAVPQHTGSFQITIRLTDDNETPLFQEYKLNIKINPLPPQNTTASQPSGSIIIQDGYFSFNAQEFTVGGRKIKKEKLTEKLNASITSVGYMGQVNIKFTKSLLMIDDIDKVREYKGLYLRLIPSFEKSTNKITDWKVTSLKDNLLKLSVEFANPLADFDKLEIKFNITQFFVSESLDSMIDYNYTMTQSIPPQLSNSSSTAMLQSLSGSAGSSMTGTITANLALSVVMGLSLKQLWMLMNTLQIIVNLPMLQVSIPSNVVMLTSSLKDISNLNLIPKDMMNSMLSLIEQNDILSTIVTVLMAFVIFSTPIMIFYILGKFTHKLKDPEFEARFGTLYLNLKDSYTSILYCCLFFLRRLLFAVSITMISAYPAFQVLLICEMVNEVVLISVAYFLIPFGMNYFDEDTAEIKYQLGWFIVAIILFVIILNWVNLVAANVLMVAEKINNSLSSMGLLIKNKAIQLTLV